MAELIFVECTAFNLRVGGSLLAVSFLQKELSVSFLPYIADLVYSTLSRLTATYMNDGNTN